MKRILAAATLSLLIAGCGSPEPAVKGGPATVRLLTEAQYRNAVADVFGGDIGIPGRFDPLLRKDGLLAAGASSASVTPSGFERYHAMAHAIATQVTDAAHRPVLVPCQPAQADRPDDACARTFFSRIGRLVFRRAIAAPEVTRYTGLAHASAETSGDFYAGLAYGLEAMLVAPDFLYIAEATEGDGDRLRLDRYARASRLSFFLWNSPPDDALLTAAEKGELDNKSGLSKAVDRMIASPRFKTGMRAFFADMLNLDKADTVQKDGTIYPAFIVGSAAEAREQTLRTLTELLITENRDYRDIFTARTTFLSRTLGLIYRLPATPPGTWTKVELPADDPRVGLLGQISLVAFNSHPNRSSPTLRGRAIRELLMCQKVPDPPSNVNFDQFNDPHSPRKTTRERLAAHATNPSCAGCHKLTDPIGLALENFDGIGQLRQAENGEPIDASGDLNGIAYTDARGLGAALAKDPAIPACLVSRAYTYGLGRGLAPTEKSVLPYFEKSFAAQGYKLPNLVRDIVLSDAFFAVSRPAGGGSGGTTASLENRS